MINLKGFPYPVIQPAFAMRLHDMANLKKEDIELCVWHHAGNPNDTDSTAVQTNNYHRNVQGWAGIGYHGLIRFNGQLELGRPLNKRGVHASAVNHKSIGFCLSGNFEIADIMTRPSQYKSAVALAIAVSKAIPGIKHVRHKDVGKTACNGKKFPWTQFIRDVEAGLKPVADKPVADNLYRIQTGAFKHRDNADRLADKLKKDGYDTYIVVANGLYKVQTGAFAKQENAISLAKNLKAAGYDVYITTKAGQPTAPAKPAPKPAIKVGSKVKIKAGAKDLNSKQTISSTARNRISIVSELKGSRAVVTYGGVVVAAVNVKDLILQ